MTDREKVDEFIEKVSKLSGDPWGKSPIMILPAATMFLNRVATAIQSGQTYLDAIHEGVIFLIELNDGMFKQLLDQRNMAPPPPVLIDKKRIM